MEHFFSIITITFNASAVIEPTLRSIKSQTFLDYEYIVVDGASNDDTLAKVKNSGIKNMKVISEHDNGLYDAMNKGIKKATGQYLIFLNAGDSFVNENVLTMYARASNDGTADIIYGQTCLVDMSRNITGMRHLSAPRELSVDSFKHGMLVCHQAFVVKRAIAPLYDTAYRFSADYDWCIKCLKKSSSNAYVGENPVICYLTDGLTDKNHKASLKERFKIMCLYYGTIPTILRHLSFIPRYLKEKRRKRCAAK